jgi:hypothetical protein
MNIVWPLRLIAIREVVGLLLAWRNTHLPDSRKLHLTNCASTLAHADDLQPVMAALRRFLAAQALNWSLVAVGRH